MRRLGRSDRLDLDLDRVRHLLAGARQHLLADELGEHDRLRLVGALLGLEVERPLGQQRHQVVDERPDARPGRAPRPGRSPRRRRARPRPAASPRSWRGRVRSTLLTAITTGTGAPRSSPAMNRSPGPMPCSALTTNRQPSASSSSCSTRRCIRSVSASRGRCTPGRSTSTSCQPGPLATPRIARRVVCGLSETIATFAPTIALASVDLPTFGRPASAMKPERVGRGAPLRPSASARPGARASRRRRSRGPFRSGAARRGRPPRAGPRCARGRSRCRQAPAARRRRRPRRSRTTARRSARRLADARG